MYYRHDGLIVRERSIIAFKYFPIFSNILLPPQPRCKPNGNCRRPSLKCLRNTWIIFIRILKWASLVCPIFPQFEWFWHWPYIQYLYLHVCPRCICFQHMSEHANNFLVMVHILFHWNYKRRFILFSDPRMQLI